MDLSEQVGHYDYLLLANEESGHRHELGSFHLFLQELSAVEEPVKVLMVFGSEGGFDSSEVELLEAQGFVSCGLGPRILRAETAPIYFLSAISVVTEIFKQ